MGFHMAAVAPESDDVELQRCPLACAYPFVEFAESLPIFRCHEIVDALSDHRLCGGGADHG